MPARPRTQVFDCEEVTALLAASPCAWWRAFIGLAVTSGLRTDEILRLHVSDVDERTFSFRVTSEPVESADQLTLRRWMPPHRERTVPADALILHAIRRLRHERPTDSHVFVPDWKIDQLWLPIVAGERLTCEMMCPGLNRWFQMIQRRARLILAKDRQTSLADVQWAHRGLRALRTTAIKKLVERLPPRSVAAHLGYASVRPVLGFYDLNRVDITGGVA